MTMTREELIRRITQSRYIHGDDEERFIEEVLTHFTESFLSILPSEKDEEESSIIIGNEPRVEDIDGLVASLDGEKEEKREEGPILEYKGFKVGDRVRLMGYPEEERVIESFEVKENYGVCARFNKDTGAGFNPVSQIEHIPPADGGKEEEDMSGLLCEGCGRTHLRCKCPENSVEFWKHRCEQYEKREKDMKKIYGNVRVNPYIFESETIADIIEKEKRIYPLDEE